MSPPHTCTPTRSQTHTEHLWAISAIKNIQIQKTHWSTIRAQKITAHKNTYTHASFHCLAACRCVSTLCWGCCSSLLHLHRSSTRLPDRRHPHCSSRGEQSCYFFSATAARSALWSAPTRNPVTQQPPYDRLTISTVCKVNSRHQSGKWRCNSI